MDVGSSTIRYPARVSPDFVAERVLETTDEQGAQVLVHVRVGRPEQVSEREWHAVHVPELDEAVHYGRGVDSLHALCNAYSRARQIFEHYEETTKRSVTWLGDNDWRVAFPRFEPSMFGAKFLGHIEDLVEAEVAQISDADFRARFKEQS